MYHTSDPLAPLPCVQVPLGVSAHPSTCQTTKITQQLQPSKFHRIRSKASQPRQPIPVQTPCPSNVQTSSIRLQLDCILEVATDEENPRPISLSSSMMIPTSSASACCLLRCRKCYDRNAEVKLRLQLWEAGEISELLGRILKQATLRSASQEKTSTAAADGRTAWETSLRLDGQVIDQQSHEWTRGWSSARLGRLSKKTGPQHSTQLGLWNSRHLCGMRRGGACCLERRQIQISAEPNEGTGSAAKQVSRRSHMSNWRP